MVVKVNNVTINKKPVDLKRVDSGDIAYCVCNDGNEERNFWGIINKRVFNNGQFDVVVHGLDDGLSSSLPSSQFFIEKFIRKGSVSIEITGEVEY